MAKLTSNDGRSFTFEGKLGRIYCIPFRRPLKPRNENARGYGKAEREWGFIINVKFDGLGRPIAQWGTKPKCCSLLDSLEGDYDLGPFIQYGEARPETPPPRLRPEVTDVVAEVEPVAEAAPNIVEPITDAGLMLFRGTTIRMRGEAGAEELCLTDMWRANGADPSKRPAKWAESKQAADLVEFLRDSAGVRISDTGFSAESGGAAGGGGTWAHWQLAFAYAKYLSPAFHAWVNQAAREKMTGRAVAPAPTVDPSTVAILRGQQEILAQIAGQLGRKPDLDQVEQVARRIAESVVSEREAENGRDVVARAGVTPPGGVQLPGHTVTAILRSVGLPTELGTGSGSAARPLFGLVVLAAAGRAGVARHQKGDWRVPDTMLPTVIRELQYAVAEFQRLGWSVDGRGNAIAGRYRVGTVVDRMIDAMRRGPRAEGPLFDQATV